MKKSLAVSIIIFVIIAEAAIFIVLNKGHIGDLSLFPIGDEKSVEEIIEPKLMLEFEQDYLLSTKKKETVPVKVSLEGEGEILLENVELESSDEKIVKINDDYELVAVKDGTAMITARYDGIEVSKEIKVITPIQSMTFTTTNSTVRVGKDLQMKLTTSPSNAYVKGLEYFSSDDEIAEVDSSGIVTGISAGTVTISVYDPYSNIEKSVKLTIRK